MSADLANLLQAMGEGRARPTQGACLAAAERIRELERQLSDLEVGGCSCGAKFYDQEAAEEHGCPLTPEKAAHAVEQIEAAVTAYAERVSRDENGAGAFAPRPGGET